MDYDLFIRGCQMLTKYELKKIKLSVHQCLLFESNDVEQINAVANLSVTDNESISKLREKFTDEEKDNIRGFKAQLKGKMLRASKKLTGSLWIKQVLIQYFMMK